MSKSSEVTATYRPNGDGEVYQVTVSAASSYPDALDEARRQATKGIHDLIADARAQYGEVADRDADKGA